MNGGKAIMLNQIENMDMLIYKQRRKHWKKVVNDKYIFELLDYMLNKFANIVD